MVYIVRHTLSRLSLTRPHGSGSGIHPVHTSPQPGLKVIHGHQPAIPCLFQPRAIWDSRSIRFPERGALFLKTQKELNLHIYP